MSLSPFALLAFAATSPQVTPAQMPEVAIQLPDNCQVVELTPAHTGRADSIFVCAPESSDGPVPVLGNNIEIPELQESVEFADLNDRWERPYIEALARQGIFSAPEDSQFNPDAPLTESEFRGWLENSLVLRAQNNPRPTEDIEAAKDEKSSVRLEQFGKTLLGKAESEAVKRQPVVSRLEAVVALVENLELSLTPEQKEKATLNLRDLDRVPEVARERVLTSIVHEIVVPDTENPTLYPNFAVTRADAAVLLYKSMVKGGGLAPIAIDVKGSIGDAQIERDPNAQPIDSPVATSELMAQLFASPDSPGVIALGMAEGTRTADGGKTSAYWGHTDPGNGKHNMGTFSFQHGARTPEEADFLQIQRLMLFTAALQDYAQANRMNLSVVELVAGIDLANQAPLAAQHYLANLQQLKARGFTGMEAILEARAYSYINPATGRLEASGFSNNWAWLRYDQARRLAAIRYALDYYGVR
ncbi:MAG: S-layer homology domain-containing protein [Cyanobacteria bacterium SID2]|nr:S-layer homology domain-containing protein [Cyanobacteria bacterium SID2]